MRKVECRALPEKWRKGKTAPNGYLHFLPVISTCETGITYVETPFDTI
jgi:hypothetical protein